MFIADLLIYNLALKMEKIIIYRTIFVRSFNDIDFDNFGIHWTRDKNFTSDVYFINNDYSENRRTGNEQFIFEAGCEDEQINKAATEISNAEYSSEAEIVLLQNTELKNVKVINRADKYPNIEILNVGDRGDSWVDEGNSQISKDSHNSV